MKSLVIAANWKSHKTNEEAKNWIASFTGFSASQLSDKSTISLIVFAPFTALAVLHEEIQKRGLPIALGAQNISKFTDGAFTGEVSGRMIAEVAGWVLVGHSERRTLLYETDDDLAAKVARAKETHLSVLYCVGDSNGRVPEGVDVVAYEPVWAIGTGKTDTPQNADAACRAIKEKTGIRRVMYGGSVNAMNVRSFISMPHIDGVLPGAASLEPQTFSELVIQALSR